MDFKEMAELLADKLTEKELTELKDLIDSDPDQLIDAITAVQQ